ncbi:hypothetical protein [Candidatus Palauibacter sp.]|uniref:hypothetical protein n=1 Tax=Candidatus Palauibacter sp. TaxID=3101350 RepID=UPI003B01FFFD
MDFQGLFTRNWPYKVAALALSILLWLRVSANTEIAEQAVPTVLEIQVSDSAWSLREAPPEITTTFRGERNQVFATRFEETLIRKVIDQVEDSVVSVELSPSEVIYNRELGVDPVSVSPSLIVIRLEERVGKRVAVAGRTDARAAPGAFVVGMATAPDSVWLQGPASFVEQISEVTTELLAVGAVSSRVTQQLAIALPPDLAGLSVDPAIVLGTVEVDSLLTREFEAPVSATGGGAGPGGRDVLLSPATVVVSISGPASVVGGLDPADLTPGVEVPASFEGAGSLPVSVQLPAGVAATVIVDVAPERVSVGPASGSSDL